MCGGEKLEKDIRARVVIRGRVQGVFFRARTRERAMALRVRGWVRNVPDGTVEAVFEGAPEAVRSMVDWVGHGPRGAIVESAEVKWEEPVGEGEFRIIY